jgi:hypothetical protein
MDPKKTRHRELTAPVAADDSVDTCPVCGIATLSERHCKVVCENCGYTESCEDLFRVSSSAAPRPPLTDA